MLKTNELKAIEIISCAYEQFFKRESNVLKINSDLIGFITRYAVLREQIHQIFLDKLSREVCKTLSNREDLHIAVFFGIDNLCESTHQYLKDSRAFFALYSYFIERDEFPSINLVKVESAIDLYSRNSLPYDARTYASITIITVLKLFYEFLYAYDDACSPNDDNQINLTFVYKQFHKLNYNNIVNYIGKLHSHNKSLFVKNITNKKIFVYRGFDIDDTQNVRLNRVKVNNPYASVQDAGKSICYSLSRKTAYIFATHKYMNHDNFNLSYEDRLSKSKLLIEKSNINIDEFANKEKRRIYVAKYEVDVKDVLFDKSYDNESEVVVLPKNARLIDYRPVKYSCCINEVSYSDRVTNS
jgi:hypothetical protein